MSASCLYFMTNSQVVRNTEQPTVKLVFELAYSDVG